ncbi:hypothetical protein SETIT_9G453800v2 [Setaria italica]|uniref:Uncharacterized protein n=1 Tax=Setaria italica TaxID=4555 RepID=A0A368SSP0_SETIT|nr:hypothetical protein SETIT_9G453800v2 [Setaria italica]
MSDISPDRPRRPSLVGARYFQKTLAAAAAASSSQQQGYERAILASRSTAAPSPSAVDGRAASPPHHMPACPNPSSSAHRTSVPPSRQRRRAPGARWSAGTNQPRANGWCGRGRATTRAPQPPNAARIIRVLPYPRCRGRGRLMSTQAPGGQGPRRARARRPMAGASPYARVRCPRRAAAGPSPEPCGALFPLARAPGGIFSFFFVSSQGLRWDTVSIGS